MDGVGCGQCFNCGALFCGNCTPELEATFSCCPMCNADVAVAPEVDAARLEALLKASPEGRHVRTQRTHACLQSITVEGVLALASLHSHVDGHAHHAVL